MQGFIPLTHCFIILSNYLHRFAHQASVHWQDVIASAINQETFGGVWRAPSPLIQTHWEARLMFTLINPIVHFDILYLMCSVSSLMLWYTDNSCRCFVPRHVYGSNAASIFVSLTSRFAKLVPTWEKSTLHLWLGCHCVMHYGYSHSCLPRSRSALCLNEALALINIQLLAPSVASHVVQKPQKHVKIRPQLKTTYSSLGYYSNLVKALGKSTAPTAAAQWGELAGGGMWMS